MQKYIDAAFSSRPVMPLSGAKVTVTTANGDLATLYSDNAGTLMDNPIYTDSAGNYSFYAADGRYTITISKTGFQTQIISDVLLEDPSDQVADLEALQLPDYAALRAYVGPRKSVYVAGYQVTGEPSGIAGMFVRDDQDVSTADNSGTVIVSASGVRWKRVHGEALNVKWFGAKGDGSTNDTAALIAAASTLKNGQSLYFPAGDYVSDSGCVLIRGKSRVAIYGDGATSRVRPSGQGPTGVKQDYPTTLAVDQCSFVTIRDIVIEGKGENYGNTDAYGGLAGGDPRTNAIINNGGSALLVARSDHVTLKGVTARYCGSVGVVYLSSCEDVMVENCFANARSLGYAGFALDNWADASVKTKRNYKFINCRTSKEDATYSGKCGISSEGDQIAGRAINLDVIGCLFEDHAVGGDAPTLGAGVSAWDTRLTMIGTVTRNCYIGANWVKRGGAVDFNWCRINGCEFLDNKVTGVYAQAGTATGGSDVSIQNTKIYSASTSVWAGVGVVMDQSVKVSSGVTVGGFFNGTIKIIGTDISGGQYGVWAIDNATYSIVGGNISGDLAAIFTYGGGTLKCIGSRLAVITGDRVIGRSTANYAATASYNMSTYINGNHLECANDTAADYIVNLGGNSALFAETQIINNSAPKGVYAAGKGSATFYDVDFPQTWTAVVSGGTTAGTYEINAGSSALTCTKNGKQVTINGYIVFAGTITGGGAGNLQITGIPYPKRAGSAAFGTVALSGLDYTANAQVTPYFGTLSASSTLLFWQTADVSNVTFVPVTAVAAGKILAFSITYETDK